jgi:hypothetical protein
MDPRILTLPALPAVLLLAGCASPGPFPSLDMRDSERVSGTIAAPSGPAFTPAPASPATLAELDSLAARASTAHQRFVAASDDVRAVVAGAAGSAAGSDDWARAQVAIAGLESLRSDVMIALADIDRIHAQAHTSGGDIARSEAARAEVSALVEQEDLLIAGLLGQLGS